MKIRKLFILSFLALLMFSISFTNKVNATDDKNLEIVACNLSFQDTVKIMYAVDSSNIEDTQNIKILIWTAPQTTYEKNSEDYLLSYLRTENIEGKNYSIFINQNVMAKQMTDDFYAVAYYNNNGTPVYSELVKYSVLQYAKNIYGTEKSTLVLDSMIKNMLEYGASAQKYFKYNLDKLANETYYQINLEGGLLEDNTTSGLFKYNQKITINTNDENFSSWTDNYIDFSNDSSTTYYVSKDTTLRVKSLYNGIYYSPINNEEYEVIGTNDNEVTEITIPETYNGLPVTNIKRYAFDYYEYLETLTFPNSIKNLEGDSIINCMSLTTVNMPNDIEYIENTILDFCNSITYNEYDNAYYLGNSTNPYLILAKAKDKNITSCVINDNCKVIMVGAFSNCEYLSDLTFNSSLVSIGKGAFENCNSLQNITIPDTVKIIDNIAFRDCDCLKTVTMGSGIINIGEEAFYLCKNLESVSLKAVQNIKDYAFYSCTSLNDVSFTNGLTKIGATAFGYCEALEEITLPSSTRRLDERAFIGCENLSEINLSTNIYYIGEGAFQNCDKLANISLPDNLEYLGPGAFMSCDNLATINLGTSLLKIEEQCFYRCIALKSITIPNSVETIGNSAFSYCDSLVIVTIGSSVAEINDYAFESCSSIHFITIPQKMKKIGYKAFSYCDSLESIIINKNISSIGDDVFYNSTRLDNIYYEGNDEDWNKINKGSSNAQLNAATLYYYSSYNPKSFENYWHYNVDEVTPISW